MATANTEIANLKGQLAAADNQLEKPRQTWQSMQPYFDFVLLLWENNKSYNLKEAKQISEVEWNIQAGEQTQRLDDIIKNIDDENFKAGLKSAWYEPLGTTDKAKKWAYIFDFLHTKFSNDIETLNSQLNP